MEKHNKRYDQKCSQCFTNCVAAKKIKDNNSNINIVYAPKNCTVIAKDDDELRLRIWSFMRPPRISSPTPIINAGRLEQVRNLLNATQNLELTKLDCIGVPDNLSEIIEQEKREKKSSYKHPYQMNKRFRPEITPDRCSYETEPSLDCADSC